MQKGKGSELQKTLNSCYVIVPLLIPQLGKALQRSCLVEVSKPDLIYYIQGKHLRDKMYRKPNLKVKSLPNMTWYGLETIVDPHVGSQDKLL